MFIPITDRISYLPASRDPLSADVILVRGDSAFWIYDVGASEEAAEAIRALPGPKNIILSHFHPDHTANLSRLVFDRLFVSRETFKHVGCGQITEEDSAFYDGVLLHVFPLPSSHAKGSLGLLIGDRYVCLGDAAYRQLVPGLPFGRYNVQLLLAQIRLLTRLPADYVLLSHEPQLLRKKDALLRELSTVYDRRTKDSPYTLAPGDMPRILSCTVPEDADGRLVRSILVHSFRIPEGMLRSLKTQPDAVLRNAAPCRLEDTVSAGDTVSVRVEDPPCTAAEAPGSRPLPILFEDEDLYIIEKPAGMAFHGEVPGEVTVCSVMSAVLGPGRAFHPVNRLDKGTGGLAVIAKSGYAHERLRMQLHTDDFVREYLALAEGYFPDRTGSITLPIGHVPGIPGKRCIDPQGAAARTDYTVLAEKEGLSLLRLRLYTGRTHQIRVHLAASGHPLAGDLLYGGRPLPSGLLSEGRAAGGFLPAGDADQTLLPALHAAFLSLRQPVSGEEIRLQSLPVWAQTFSASCLSSRTGSAI